MRAREDMVDIAESEERKEELLELKRKTFKKMEELAEREQELERRKKTLTQARKRLEKLRTELSEKEKHLELWETELRTMGMKLAEESATATVPAPQLHPKAKEKKKKLFRLGKKRKRASKS